jgi:glycosyltransferase involved in cell wall biosynthesis
MRIAQIAPLYESVPPKLYGGTERVVAWLTKALVHRGHEVTLFASGDSRTSARLISPCPRALRLDGAGPDAVAMHTAELADAFTRSAEFDVMHSHVDYLAFPFSRRARSRVVHTMHGRLDAPHVPLLFDEFGDLPVVSISDAQRAPLRGRAVNWAGTVHHGLPVTDIPFGADPEAYLVFLGRMSPEKRPDLAIEIARRVGLPLKVAAKVEVADRHYFDRVISPLLDDPLVEFVGEVNDAQKFDLLGGALCLLFPIDWPEPFGITMIESLACGTPVIARPCGAVPEIVIDGVTGFIGDTVEELAHAVKRLDHLDRARCRLDVQERFSIDAMATRYEAVYASL